MEFGKSLTQQNFRESTNINNIVERSQRAGMLPPNGKIPQYADVSNVPDYQSALNTVIKANQMFASLPSRVRERFGNHPEKMVEFIQDPANIDEAVKLGLLTKATTPVEEPIKVDPSEVGEIKKPDTKKNKSIIKDDTN